MPNIPELTRIESYQVVHFKDTFVNPENGKKIEKEVLLIYALGEDGILYEMMGGKWLGFPIIEENMREMPKPPPELLAKLNERK